MTSTKAAVADPVRAPMPHEVIWDLAEAVIPSRALHVVAELGVADALGDARATAGDLAARCGVDAHALARVLTLLCAHGVFRRDGDQFVHNAASELLRSDHPASMRGFARLNGLPIIRDALAALAESVRTGTSGAAIAHPPGFFPYLVSHPGEAAVFGEAMAGKARADIADVLACFDVSPFSTVADIGGGQGHLLRAVLDVAADAHGILFELPPVIASMSDGGDRMRLHAGDFFHDALPAADLYLLMEVIHDWADDAAAAILSAVRRAASPGAVVLVIEHVAPDEGVDRVSATLDVQMLAVTGGRERSAAELARLLHGAGFAIRDVVPTAGPITIVAAVAV